MPRWTLLVRIVGCLVLVVVPITSMDDWLYDRFFRVRGPLREAAPFLLVRIHEAKLFPRYFDVMARPEEGETSLQARRLFAWQPQVYPQLLEKILAKKPKKVIFSTYFDWVGQTDQPLPKEVLLSSVLDLENRLIPPSPRLTIGDNFGFNNVFPDPDNTVRSHRLLYSSVPSLALRASAGERMKPVTHNLNLPMWIDFRGPKGTYPSADANEILDDLIPESAIRDKIVLIGREESPAEFNLTPFGPMAQEEIIANTIDTFLSGREIRGIPKYVSTFIAVGIVCLSIVLIMLFPLTLAWIFLVLLSLVMALISLFLFSQFKLWLSIASPIFCVFGTHLIMVGYKLRRQEEEQWQIEQESKTLREMDRFKNNFISLFSHDLKTPLAKIKAVVDRSLNDTKELSSLVRDNFKTIDRANEELSRLISDILKVTKMETHAIEPKKGVVDLNRIAQKAIERLTFAANEKKIELVADLEPLFSMEGDDCLIEEVVTNLVENAIKYSPNGSRVIVRTGEEDGKVKVSVQDQGPGIPDEELPKVTSKFFRGRKAAGETKGTGLGLYLAKYFVELHDGRLEIHSVVGEGTRVSFWLPLP